MKYLNLGLLEYPPKVAVDCLQSKWPERSKSKPSEVFYDLAGLHKLALFSVRGNYAKALTTGGKNYWGPSWRLVITTREVTKKKKEMVFIM